MDGSPHRPFRTVICSSWLILSVVVLVAIPGCPSKPTPPAPVPTTTVPGKPQKLTREDSVKLLAMRDRAIGHLENIEFDQAQPLLLDIIRQVPDDPFGLRNLVICRELIVDKLDPSRGADQRTAAIKSANEAVEKLFVAEPKSYVPHVLAARMAMKENNTERAATELRRAIELAPQSAPVWYDLFLLNPLSPGEPPAKETIEALRRTHELEPDNLFVLKDWLLLQTQLKEPQLTETVTQARATLGPFADVIKTNTRVNISDLLDRLSKAIDAMQWPAANSAAMTIRNVIVAESSRDERYVHKNSLEYVLFDYGSAFYDRADLADPTSDSIPVTFAAGTQALGVPKGASHFIAEDLDFDGQIDGVGLAGDQLLIVMPLAAKTPEDASVIKQGIGEGFSSLLAVDLDDDINRKLNLILKKNAIADLDLIAYGAAGIKLFEQTSADGVRAFVARPAGDALAALRDIRCVVPADLDLDGDLDFLTMTAQGVQFWSNKGNWTFDDVTSRSKLPAKTLELTSAAAVDWDRDSDIDVLVTTSAGLGLLENMHHGRFRWRALEGDFAGIKGATSLLIEQLGRRPSWSVIAGGPSGVQVAWTETTAAGVVSAKTAVAVDTAAATSLQSLDFDNDGIRDLLALADSKLKLWRGLPNGQFQSQPIPDAANKDVTAVAIGDIDRDGDEDLLWCGAGMTSWLANNGGNANGWLDVSLVAEQLKPNEQNYSKRVNNHGIGSMIEVRAGDRYQAQVVRCGLTHFGLGADKQAQVMRTLWTNGLPNNLIAPAPNQRIYEEQILIGSCPYLYTWDGEKFAFYTDLLWNAPLGLKFAEDVVALWREWEYLKIDGDRLKAKDGAYPLRVTAELWEVEYFDEIKLFAVDHPIGTQIFTNEKVGPESLATHKIHTVATPHVPVAARDPQGRDILDQVKARDGIYTKTYERKFAQGLTNEHFLELDLGAWPQQAGAPSPSNSSGDTKPPVVMLFLTGWMYPGSTSLRVQHSQNPDLQSPRPPALHAVDAAGQWHPVRPFMGFPGGKTKTIAVDISDVFVPGSTDHRLRIVTSMEFYWDAAFFTVNDQPVEFQQFELPLASAKLVDRGGVSRHSWPETGNGPDQFDYQDVVPGDAWPPIDGAFTRFGDVLPLLKARDDHLVVLHPGDEMQLEFTVPSTSLRAGWVRDFVIYNVGWDKDCDHHTVYGETSEPLPFRAMTVYPFRDSEVRAMDDEYEQYLKTYQTRRRARGPFWNRVSNK
ncbi:MAG: hypothetical protein JWP89_7002 [Schlesneria sp.]|nr:hypothetical protein [Schlesneria sp.]